MKTPKDEVIIQKEMILYQENLRYYKGENKSLLPAVDMGPQELIGILLIVTLHVPRQTPPPQDTHDFYSNILHFFQL